MSPKTTHPPYKAARDRAALQRQALDARIKRGPYEQARQQQYSVSRSRFVLNLGNSIRVNFVVAEQGRSRIDEFLTSIRVVVSVFCLFGMIAIAGYGIWRHGEGVCQ